MYSTYRRTNVRDDFVYWLCLGLDIACVLTFCVQLWRTATGQWDRLTGCEKDTQPKWARAEPNGAFKCTAAGV
jgi:hypothetical protein